MNPAQEVICDNCTGVPVDATLDTALVAATARARGRVVEGGAW